MKVLWALEPSSSIYDGLRGVRQLLPDGLSLERMIFLQEWPRGVRRAAAALPEGDDGRRAFSARQHLVATVRAFCPDIVVVIMPSLLSSGTGFRGDLPIMLCHEARCPVLLVNPATLPVRRLAIVGPSVEILQGLARVLVAFAPPSPLDVAAWLTLPRHRAPGGRSREVSGQLTTVAFPGVSRRAAKLLEDSLGKLMDRLRRTGWSVRCQVLPGAGAKAVAAKAVKEEIDLLVCPYPRLDRMSRASAATAGLLAEVPCSALAVPTGGAGGAQDGPGNQS